MSDSISHTFELPLGYISKSADEILKKVEVKEMTVRTRKAMGSSRFRNNSAKLITFLLKQCVTCLGDSPPNMSQLRGLTVGDRDFLLLKIRQVSLGDIIQADYTCKFCKEHNRDVRIDINYDIPIKRFDPDEYDIEDGLYIATLENKELDVECRIALPNGDIQEKLSPLMAKDSISANYRMYELCLKEWNGEPGPFKSDFVDNIPVRVSDWIDDAHRKVQGGPDWMIKKDCEFCYGENVLTLENSDFLFKTPA